MTDRANNFYYCAKLALKIVDFQVDYNVFWNAKNAPYCTILIKKFPTPKHESESTSLQDISSCLV